jgi:hypothetical protein
LNRTGILHTNAIQVLAVNAAIRVGEIHVVEEVVRLHEQLEAQILMQRKVLRE